VVHNTVLISSDSIYPYPPDTYVQVTSSYLLWLWQIYYNWI